MHEGYKREKWHVNWLWNRETCQSQGGDLVSIETEEEWNFINDQIQRRNSMNYRTYEWSIGLRKKAGNWTWVNGRPLTICKWGQGEPRGEYDAAFMYQRYSTGERGVFGSLNSTSWKYVLAYICEISKGKLFCFRFLIFFIITIILSKLKALQALRRNKSILCQRFDTHDRIFMDSQ